MTKTRLIRILILSVIGLAIAGLIAFSQIQNEGGKRTSGVVAKNFGGDFTLIDQDGKTVTQDDFKGQYRLIYFGFTFCPAICPTELQKITTVLNQLGDKADQIQPIFVTVDPERDTPEVMKQYISLFHPRLIGLSGSVAQIDVAKKAYKIFATKVQDDTMSDYTVDHSSFIYFLDPEDTLLRIFKVDDTAENMKKHIAQSIP